MRTELGEETAAALAAALAKREDKDESRALPALDTARDESEPLN